MSSPGPSGITAGENRAPTKGPRSRLARLVAQWDDLDEQIKAITRGEQPNPTPGSGSDDSRSDRLREQRSSLADEIRGIVDRHPELAGAAADFGFNPRLLTPVEPSGPPGAGVPGRGREDDQRAERGGGGGTGSASSGSRGGGGGSSGGGLGSRERLKNFTLYRLPSGRVVAVRNIDIAGNKVQWGVWVDKGDFDKYGVNESSIRSMTQAQAKKLEVMGNADELMFRGDDTKEFRAIVRGITRAHKGSPILDDDEVLGIIVAQSALGLTDNETQGLLKQSGWYKRSTEHEQVWTLDYSPEKRQEDIRNMRVTLIDNLEDTFGQDWQKHVEGGMKQVRDWATRIASGEFGGDPQSGLDRWLSNQIDRAEKIEGTPAWMQRQSEEQETRRFANRPEEMFERLRTEALGYLGYDKNDTPRLDRGTLQQWAGQLVTGEKSEHDWAEFLRKQMETLFPYFDRNIAFTEQASAYRSIAERVMGDTLDWSDDLLRDFSQLDANGKPTGDAMSLHDFELKVRGDDRAWQQGTQVFDEVVQVGDILLNKMLGVG